MTVLVLYYIPLYILATVAAALVVKWGARFVTDSKWPYRTVLIAAISWPVGEYAYVKFTLQWQCGSDAGDRIYRTVENVDGLILPDNGCSSFCPNLLIYGDHAHFRFVEARVKWAAPSMLGAVSADLPPGLYRFSVEEPGHPNCQAYDAWLMHKKGLQDHPEFKSNCIAAEEIPEFTARYELIKANRELFTNVGTISVSETRYIDRVAGDTVAERINCYMNTDLFWPFAFNPHFSGDNSVSFNAHDILKPMSN